MGIGDGLQLQFALQDQWARVERDDASGGDESERFNHTCGNREYSVQFGMGDQIAGDLDECIECHNLHERNLAEIGHYQLGDVPVECGQCRYHGGPDGQFDCYGDPEYSAGNAGRFWWVGRDHGNRALGRYHGDGVYRDCGGFDGYRGCLYVDCNWDWERRADGEHNDSLDRECHPC